MFDISDVLWRDTGFRLAKKWAAHCGLTIEAFDLIAFAPEWGEPTLVGSITSDEKWASIGAELKLTSAEIIEIQADAWTGRWDVGLLNYIRTLKPHYKIGVISNASSGTREKVKEWVNEDLFDVIVISAEEKTCKPGPTIYQTALQKLDVEPSAAIFIDHDLPNVMGARAVGINAMIYSDFHLMRPELNRYLGKTGQGAVKETLIVLPTELEHQLFLDALDRLGWQGIYGNIGRMPSTHFPIPNITVAQGGLGKTRFAVSTQHLLDSSANWDLVICVGAAGSLLGSVMVGNIIAATTTIEHDIINHFDRPLLPRFAGDAATLEKMQHMPPAGYQVELQFGPIASGDEDVITFTRQAEIQERTDALVVAWEGAGGGRACEFSGVPFLELRGVTNIANANATYDFDANLPMVMENLAVIVRALVLVSMQDDNPV